MVINDLKQMNEWRLFFVRIKHKINGQNSIDSLGYFIGYAITVKAFQCKHKTKKKKLNISIQENKMHVFFLHRPRIQCCCLDSNAPNGVYLPKCPCLYTSLGTVVLLLRVHAPSIRPHSAKFLMMRTRVTRIHLHRPETGERARALCARRIS